MGQLKSSGEQVMKNVPDPSNSAIAGAAGLAAAAAGAYLGGPEAQAELALKLALEAEALIIKLLLGDEERKRSTIQKNISKIDDLVSKRAAGIEPEPEINAEALVNHGVPGVVDSLKKYRDIFDPNLRIRDSEESAEEQRLRNLERLTRPSSFLRKSTFDVVYGPPISNEGHFILSEDGLYYDSRSGGLPEVSGVVEASKSWNLTHAPNLGGKGIIYTTQGVSEVVDSIFDSRDIRTEESLNAYFDGDTLIQSFERDKSAQIHSVSSQITNLVEDLEYETNSAVVSNYYRSIGALAATYDSRILKRKKQIQLGVVFGGYRMSEKDFPLGAGILLDSAGHPVPHIPINDFTFLKGKGIAPTLEQQLDVILMSEDVDDTTLPLVPKFLQASLENVGVIDTFRVDSPTPGSFSYYQTSAGSNHASSVGPQVNNLTDFMVKEGLIINYNFTQPNVIDNPSSFKFNVDNTADSNLALNGQLLAGSVATAFPQGLGIVYLTGADTSAGQSCIRLPNNSRDGDPYPGSAPLDDLFYSNHGCTIDFWTHLPPWTITGGEEGATFWDSARYRLVMANENSGGSNRPDNDTAVFADRTLQEFTEGMLIGFRDKGGKSAPSGGEFGVWPTVGQNHQDGLWSDSVCIAEGHQVPWPTTEQTSEFGFSVPLTAPFMSSGVSKTLSAVYSEFLHLAVTFNPQDDVIGLYADGDLVMASSIREAFGMTSSMDLLNIPTYVRKDNRFGKYYLDSFDWPNNIGPRIGTTGSSPLLHELAFTPWILGGGFTDGMPGGFLGANTNTTYNQPSSDSTRRAQHENWPYFADPGTRASSALGGYLGSFKIYNKPLSNNEVRRNYLTQRGFFKNIKLS
jgi:hypothetical protein